MKLIPTTTRRKAASVADILAPVNAARQKAAKDLEVFSAKRSGDSNALSEQAAMLAQRAAEAAREAQEAADARAALAAG